MKIANIGSSFSAGPGLHPQTDANARRSAANFAHLFAKHLDAELIDLSVSGATLLNMLNEPQVTNGHKFPPQIDGIPLDVDLVLVLGGGNDMGYIPGIIAETWLGWLLLQAQSLFSVFSNTKSLPANEDEVYQRYGMLLDAIHAKVPQARVAVIEYLTVFGTDAIQNPSQFCRSERAKHHQSIATQLQKVTSKVVDERKPWCELLPTAQGSEGHGLGSEEPWIFGLDFSVLMRKEAWVHPNKKGMEFVANMLKEWFTNSNQASL